MSLSPPNTSLEVRTQQSPQVFPTTPTKSLSSISWNIEGLKRNLFGLNDLVDKTNPHFVFLSEPQIFSSDLPYCMSLFRGKYCFELNSEDKHDPEAALLNHKSNGGTMVMWQKSLDMYVSIFPVSSTAFLPLIYKPPGFPISVHFALYLPTSGKDSDFTEQITELSNCIDDLYEKYGDCLIFIRGDGNVNRNNLGRMKLFNLFLTKHNLSLIQIDHKTYHHFLGGGAFDSNIDIIAHTSEIPHQESVTSIFCIQEYPHLDSHHDPILSEIILNGNESPEPPDDLPCAPQVHHVRHKIIWSEDGISEYEKQVSTKLSQIRQKWLNPLSKTSLSLLLSLTNFTLDTAAAATNRSVDLSKASFMKPAVKSNKIKKSEKLLNQAFKAFKDAKVANDKTKLGILKPHLDSLKKEHRRNIRSLKNHFDSQNDEKLFKIMTTNPSAAFSLIRSSKSISPVQVPYIQVGENKFVGEKVVDGLYLSISELKTLDYKMLKASPYHSSLMEDYSTIKYLCRHKFDIPPASLKTTSQILLKMKATVIDFFSLTPLHFINAGSSGFIHFNLLLNALITDVNNSTIEELNTIFALLLYKGHNKERTLDTSYRTISTCPVLAKGLDFYIKDLFIDKWNSKQASTQYQGEGSSHELASLLVTEVVQLSRFYTKKPVFLLFLDTKSAFDTVVIPYLVRSLYQAGMEGNSLLYMENRLASRLTFCEFNKKLAGPIKNQQGLEQGGLSSSDCYKLYNTDCLNQTQQSKLGVELSSSLTISSVGQADDTVLMSNDLHKLNLLLYLAMQYCSKFNVQLSQIKTKLLHITPPRSKAFVPYNPVSMFGKPVKFVEQAEHVGVIRSKDGNLPNLLQRISSFKRAIGSIISCGLARSQRSNPMASLRILSLYGTPVLMSGLASLVLNSKEIASLDQQLKRTIESLLRLPPRTPASVVYFISGTLPGTAILHLRQLCLLGMISRLPGDPIHQHAEHALLCLPKSANSWFYQLKVICLQYNLPHPLILLKKPLSKEAFKKLIKAKVIDFWEIKLRKEAIFLPSLEYFQPEFYSLSSPHRILTSAGQKSYEVAKARIQLLFLANKYPCNKNTRHWSPQNPQGYCPFQPCTDNQIVESQEHILLHCPVYNPIKQHLYLQCLSVSSPASHQVIMAILLSQSHKNIMQFLLDCSVLPDVIRMAQIYGEDLYKDLYYISRTWCFSHHRLRMKKLGKWNFR